MKEERKVNRTPSLPVICPEISGNSSPLTPLRSKRASAEQERGRGRWEKISNI